MRKKVITIVVTLCLIFSASVITVSAVNETAPGAPQQQNAERPNGGRGGMPPMGEMPSGEFTQPQNAEKFAPQQSESNNTDQATPPSDAGLPEGAPQTPEQGKEWGRAQGGNFPFGGQMPEGMGGFPGNMQGTQNATEEQPTGFVGFVKTNSTPITALVLLGLAFIFVIFYRRKNY